MAFNQNEATALMAACHRRCCICHRFCGVKMELDHMLPQAEGEPDTIDNAIAVCFECHAEIHSYNPQHPRGRRFRPEELRQHKKQWMKICAEQPEALVSAPEGVGVGPLQALIDELDFNLVVSAHADADSIGAMLSDRQFMRAMEAGAISVLDDGLKDALLKAYAATSRANQSITIVSNFQRGSNAWGVAVNRAGKIVSESRHIIEAARTALLKFLQPA